MSVPDHLIEKDGRRWTIEVCGHCGALTGDGDCTESCVIARPAYVEVMPSAVADELRAEGARAERERIARQIEAIADTAREHGYEEGPLVDAATLVVLVREGGDTNAQ